LRPLETIFNRAFLYRGRAHACLDDGNMRRETLEIIFTVFLMVSAAVGCMAFLANAPVDVAEELNLIEE